MNDSFLNEWDLFDNCISESDMLCSIYENQRYLIEQDTQIFMALEYTFIDEGVTSTIFKVVSNIFTRIKELIMKFINFIKGNRKRDQETEKDVNLNENEEKIKDEIDENINELKKKKMDEMSAEEKKEYERKIMELNYNIQSEEYNYIEINDNLMQHINITDKWTEIEKAVDNLDDLISLVKTGNDYEKINNILSKIGDFKGQTDKYTIPFNKCNKDEYYKKYYKDIKLFYRNYTDDSAKNIEYLQNLYNNKINSTEKKISLLKDENIDNKLIKKITDICNYISLSCTNRINLLFQVEKGYKMYKKNSETTFNFYKELDALNKKLGIKKQKK